MNDMRPYVPRILSGTEIGSWQETVYGTVFRSNNNWLICRARGKGNGGRITGSRFYVIARDGMARPHKIRNGGSVRYFDNVRAAAIAAYKYSIEQEKKWSKQTLISELHALELQKKTLLLEIESLCTKSGALRKYVNSLNGNKTRLLDAVRSLSSSDQSKQKPGMADAENEKIARGLMPWIDKVAMHVIRHRYLH